MDPITLGLGLGLSVINTGLNASKANRQKSLMRKASRINAQALEKNYDLSKRKLASEEAHANKENADAERNINESASERGLFDSSIKTDEQGERGYSYGRRMEALKFARESLENQYFTDKKLAKINQLMNDSSGYLDMIQQFIQGGAMSAMNAIPRK